MEHLWRSISEARTLDELLALMAVLSRRTELLLLQKRLTEGDILRIMQPLATLRQLLTRLAARESGPEGSAEQALLAGSLAERYLELEGRIKELRNDQELARRRPAA